MGTWLVEEHPPRSVLEIGTTGCEVSTYWSEVKDDYEHVQFAVAPYRWGGIGVLWKT